MTTRRASIIHGYNAAPTDHWFGWLAERLDADGIPTTIPVLPDATAPDPEAWAGTLRAEVGTPDEQRVVVAHSLGCLAVLRHLRSTPEPWNLAALVLVAGFVDPLPALPELDNFIGDGCDPTGLADRVGRITVLRSDADQYVPTAHTDRLAQLLGTEAQVVPGAGHFMGSDGVATLPEAYRAVAG